MVETKPKGKELLDKQTGLLVILTGFTASGKTDIRKALTAIDPRFQNLVTTTARLQREGEIDGIDYHFKTEPQFLQMLQNGELLEYTRYGGNFYGTTKQELEKMLNGQNLISSMEISGAATFDEKVRQAYPHKIAEEILGRTLIVFVEAESLKILRKRFVKRRGGLSNFEQRISEDEVMLEKYGNKFTHRIKNLNGQLVSAVNQLEQVISENNPNNQTAIR